MTTPRREFLRQSAIGAMSAWAVSQLAAEAPAKVAPSEKMNLAIIGLRGRGSFLGPHFAARPDCHVSWLADVDSNWLAPRAKAIEEVQHTAPQTATDLRQVLDDPAVDAVVVATPDHWHALATVWACQAGKDVYVEKPVSHSPWEARQMVAAARKHGRIVQAGFQNRSANYNREAKAYLDSGKLGTIHFVKVINQKEWANVPSQPDAPTPTGFDWDMWNGPAPAGPYNPTLHGAWNHFWRYSGGDIINDAVHQIDLARWLVGKDFPKTVYSVGGRYAQEGALETPDTQVAIWEFDNLVMSFDLTLYTPYMIKSDQALRDSDDFPYWPQNAERIEIYGSEGLMIVGRHGCGWQVFGRPHSRKPVIVDQGNGPFPDPEHKQNFCDSIRSRELPSADIEEGRRSTLLCQLANISYRLGGQKLHFDATTEQVIDNDAANQMQKREYREPYAVPEIS